MRHFHHIHGRNATAGLVAVLNALRTDGTPRNSRNGPVLVLDGPTIVTYERPRERVIHWPERDANPFFHFFESLWILAGRRDLKFVERFVATMRNYSDDGKFFHGAYGHRWRHHFGKDQLQIVAERLRANHEDRRCVLGMWDPRSDLNADSKDLPCNTHCFVQVNAEGALDFSVLNRSNDAAWGAFGANVVHFTFAHEVLAAMVGVPMGRFTQFSQNMHGYLATTQPLFEALDAWDGEPPDAYTRASDGEETIEPYRIVNEAPGTWFEDLWLFLDNPVHTGLRDVFFRQVAQPLWFAHAAFKERNDPERFLKAQEILRRCAATDWRLAADGWLQRREARAERAKDDGVQS